LVGWAPNSGFRRNDGEVCSAVSSARRRFVNISLREDASQRQRGPMMVKKRHTAFCNPLLSFI
jgi:hypothetical protein